MTSVASGYELSAICGYGGGVDRVNHRTDLVAAGIKIQETQARDETYERFV